MRLLLVLAALLVSAPSGSQETARATVTTAAPIFLQPGAQAPLRVAAIGTSLKVLKEQGEWAEVEFTDPQFGRRIGWVQTKFVEIVRPELQPMDLSVKDNPVAKETRPEQRQLAKPSRNAETEKQDDFTRIYDVPMEKLFVAAAQVAALKWNVTHTDKDTGIISFKTGMNMRTFKGFEMTAVCMPMGDSKTQVSVRPQRRESGQLFSWKEGNRIAATFHKELEKRLKQMAR